MKNSADFTDDDLEIVKFALKFLLLGLEENDPKHEKTATAISKIIPFVSETDKLINYIKDKMSWNGCEVEDKTDEYKRNIFTNKFRVYIKPKMKTLLLYTCIEGSSVIPELKETLKNYGNITFSVNHNGDNYRGRQWHEYLIQIM